MRSILFINYEYPPIGAGAATATWHIATSMARHGDRISIVTSAFGDKRGVAEEDGVTVHRLPAIRRHAGRSSLLQMFTYVGVALLRLPTIIKKQRPDAAIVFFVFPCGPIGLLLKLRWRIPCLLMLRGGDVPGFESSLDRIHRLLHPVRSAVYRTSNAIIANSNGLRDLALQSDPTIAIEVIPNGVDTEFFRPANTATTNPQMYTFLFAGRICTQKNLDVLIEAFSQCHSNNKQLRLAIIGEGPELERLQRSTISHGIKSSVHWVGWCTKKELRSYYQSADCFVNPSTNEGMSNALLEAMACGLPVVAGDCPGNREIITDGRNGFLFAPKDLRQLAKLMRSLSNDNEHCRALGRNGRELCCSRHSWENSAKRISGIIEECTKK